MFGVEKIDRPFRWITEFHFKRASRTYRQECLSHTVPSGDT